MLTMDVIACPELGCLTALQSGNLLYAVIGIVRSQAIVPSDALLCRPSP